VRGKVRHVDGGRAEIGTAAGHEDVDSRLSWIPTAATAMVR